MSNHNLSLVESHIYQSKRRLIHARLTRFRRPMTNDIKPTINPLVHSHSLIPNHLHYGHCASSWNRPHTNTYEVWSLTVSQFNLCKVVIIDRQDGGGFSEKE